MKFKFILFTVVLTIFLKTTAEIQAAIIADWTFETSVPTTSGPYAAEGGINGTTSFASGSHASTSTSYSNPTGNGSSESFSATRWAIGDYWQFSSSSTGYKNIMLEWDQGSSATGPSSFELFWSADGGSTFTTAGSFQMKDVVTSSPNPTLWKSSASLSTTHYSADLSSILFLNNAANILFQLRDNSITAVNGGTVGTSGSSRIDNFVISGDTLPIAAVPEPATYLAGALLLLPFGVHGIRYFRNRKHS